MILQGQFYTFQMFLSFLDLGLVGMQTQFTCQSYFFKNEIIIMSLSETSTETGKSTSWFNANLFLDSYLPLIGVIRCQWESSGTITTITYGTAILLSQRVILTCTHNIFSEKMGRKCDSAYFIPGAHQNFLLKFKNYYISNQRSFKYTNTAQTFRFKPLTEELSLILLSQPYQNTQNVNYPKIGTTQLSAGSPLTIAAYPSRHYYSRIRMSDVYPQRSILTGSLHSFKEPVINHTMPTSIGMSGAPIFAKNQANQYFICGIHTHRGQEEGYNSGLFFNSEVVKKLRDFFDELKRENGLEENLNLFEINGADINQKGLDDSFQNSLISCFDDLLGRDDDFDNDYRNSSLGKLPEKTEQF